MFKWHAGFEGSSLVTCAPSLNSDAQPVRAHVSREAETAEDSPNRDTSAINREARTEFWAYNLGLAQPWVF